MNLGRISVKRIFLLVSCGMAASMLAVCAVFFVVAGQVWMLASGMILTICALVWMFLLTIAFSKRLSIFTGELCRAMDQMISGSCVQPAGQCSEIYPGRRNNPNFSRTMGNVCKNECVRYRQGHPGEQSGRYFPALLS